MRLRCFFGRLKILGKLAIRRWRRSPRGTTSAVSRVKVYHTSNKLNSTTTPYRDWPKAGGFEEQYSSLNDST